LEDVVLLLENNMDQAKWDAYWKERNGAPRNEEELAKLITDMSAISLISFMMLLTRSTSWKAISS